MLPKKKKKIEESAAAHWCFKVCSPYRTVSEHGHCIYFRIGLFLILFYRNILFQITMDPTGNLRRPPPLFLDQLQQANQVSSSKIKNFASCFSF
jgi:hypothetical protein